MHVSTKCQEMSGLLNGPKDANGQWYRLTHPNDDRILKTHTTQVTIQKIHDTQETLQCQQMCNVVCRNSTALYHHS